MIFLLNRLKNKKNKIKQMKNNLNALAGASQQCDLFLKELEDKERTNA